MLSIYLNLNPIQARVGFKTIIDATRQQTQNIERVASENHQTPVFDLEQPVPDVTGAQVILFASATPGVHVTTQPPTAAVPVTTIAAEVAVNATDASSFAAAGNAA